jgi:hypothetical protein
LASHGALGFGLGETIEARTGEGVMPKEAALVISWEVPRQGRELKSIEVFMEALGFYAQKAAEGIIQEPDVFVAEDESNGFIVIKGQSDALRELSESDEAQELLLKAHMIVDGLKSHWYFTGDEIQASTARFAKVAQDSGIV